MYCRPVALLLQFLTGKQFFPMSFVSHGITLAKHMIKYKDNTINLNKGGM